LRREEKFAEAAQLMLSAPKDPARLHNLDEWWIERRLLARKMIDSGEHKSAYLIRARTRHCRRATSTRRAGVHPPAGSRCASSTIRKQPRNISRESASAASIPPRWRAAVTGRPRRGSRRPHPGSARRLHRCGEQSTSYYGQLGARQARAWAARSNDAPTPKSRGVERLEIVRAVQLLFDLDERDIAIPIFADMGENGDPTRWSDWAN